MTVRGGDERGSAPVEFLLVSLLLTILTLAVLQLGLALHIRNTVVDAAAEGARYAALADNDLDAGVTRTRELVSIALGGGYAEAVDARYADWQGHPSVIVTVHAPLPLIGMIGLDSGLEVSGHAAVEVLD